MNVVSFTDFEASFVTSLKDQFYQNAQNHEIVR